MVHLQWPARNRSIETNVKSCPKQHGCSRQRCLWRRDSCPPPDRTRALSRCQGSSCRSRQHVLRNSTLRNGPSAKVQTCRVTFSSRATVTRPKAPGNQSESASADRCFPHICASLPNEIPKFSRTAAGQGRGAQDPSGAVSVAPSLAESCSQHPHPVRLPTGEADTHPRGLPASDEPLTPRKERLTRTCRAGCCRQQEALRRGRDGAPGEPSRGVRHGPAPGQMRRRAEASPAPAGLFGTVGRAWASLPEV